VNHSLPSPEVNLTIPYEFIGITAGIVFFYVIGVSHNSFSKVIIGCGPIGHITHLYRCKYFSSVAVRVLYKVLVIGGPGLIVHTTVIPIPTLTLIMQSAVCSGHTLVG
jgi:hypothetical protein